MGYTVLVVDDSKLARMAVAKSLGRLRPDWQIHEAANAEEARKVMAEQGIDIALIDFNMPGQDGLELAEEFRDMVPGMPVAILTANIQDGIIARARELDAGFVPKPLADENLEDFLDGAALRLRSNKT